MVDGLALILRSSYRSFMNNEMNWGPLSEVIFCGIPCSLNIELQNMIVTPLDVMVSMMGKRWIILENQSTMTSMAFLPSDWRRGPMRSTDMISHGEDRISFG